MSGDTKFPGFPWGMDADTVRLRDDFAGKALIGIVTVDKNNHDAKDQSFEVDATLAYRYADAMLKARKS